MIKNICSSCKGTKQILLLENYVECLDCTSSLEQSIKWCIESFRHLPIKKPHLELTLQHNFVGNSEFGSVGLDHSDTRLLVLGQAGCGKTYFVNNYIKTLHEKNKYTIVIIDTEHSGYGHYDDSLIQTPTDPTNLKDITSQIKHSANILNPPQTIILKLSQLELNKQYFVVTDINNTILDTVRQTNYRHSAKPIIYVHDNLFSKNDSNNPDFVKWKSSLRHLLQIGRNYRMSYILVGQRSGKIHRDIVSECNNFIIGKSVIESDNIRHSELLYCKKKYSNKFESLKRGEFFAGGPNFNFFEFEKTFLVNTK